MNHEKPPAGPPPLFIVDIGALGELTNLRLAEMGNGTIVYAEDPGKVQFRLLGPDTLQLVEECGRISREKGFRSDFHRTEIALITTEIAEALEHTTPSGRPTTDAFVSAIIGLCNRYKQYQQIASIPYEDHSEVTDPEKFIEELADIIIRCFSYAGGNGLGPELVSVLVAKIQKNAGRPPLHGKAF